jgi:hypothetical protein
VLYQKETIVERQKEKKQIMNEGMHVVVTDTRGIMSPSQIDGYEEHACTPRIF